MTAGIVMTAGVVVTAGVRSQHRPRRRQHVLMLAVRLGDQVPHTAPAAGPKAGKCCQQSRRPASCQHCILCVTAASACRHPHPSLAAASDVSHQLAAAQPPHACSQHYSLLIEHLLARHSCPPPQQCAAYLTAADRSTATWSPLHSIALCCSAAAGTSLLLAAAISSPFSPFFSGAPFAVQLLTAADAQSPVLSHGLLTSSSWQRCSQTLFPASPPPPPPPPQPLGPHLSSAVGSPGVLAPASPPLGDTRAAACGTGSAHC